MSFRQNRATAAVAPLDYRVRVRADIHSVRLRVTYQRGLEVTVPRGFNTSRIPALLESERGWIREAIGRLEARKLLEAQDPWCLPSEITLPAIGASWRVVVRASGAAGASVREADSQHLLVRGAVSDVGACRKALCRWLMRKARVALVAELRAASLRAGLSYRRVAVRRQRTRWASCSSRGTISLSANLLFLPRMVVAYVLTHELCHLREMNHSKRFWRLVSQHYPDYRAAHAQLRQMRKAIPRWAA